MISNLNTNNRFNSPKPAFGYAKVSTYVTKEALAELNRTGTKKKFDEFVKDVKRMAKNVGKKEGFIKRLLGKTDEINVRLAVERNGPKQKRLKLNIETNPAYISPRQQVLGGLKGRLPNGGERFPFASSTTESMKDVFGKAKKWLIETARNNGALQDGQKRGLEILF